MHVSDDKTHKQTTKHSKSIKNLGVGAPKRFEKTNTSPTFDANAALQQFFRAPCTDYQLGEKTTKNKQTESLKYHSPSKCTDTIDVNKKDRIIIFVYTASNFRPQNSFCCRPEMWIQLPNYSAWRWYTTQIWREEIWHQKDFLSYNIFRSNFTPRR